MRMLQMELEDQVQISGSFEDLCDQNVMIYLLRVKAKEYMPGVLPPAFLHLPVCLQMQVPVHAPPPAET